MHIRSSKRTLIIINAVKTENHILTIRTSVKLRFSLKEKIFFLSPAFSYDESNLYQKHSHSY